MNHGIEGAAVEERSGSPLGRKVLGGGIALVISILGWYVGAAVIPRWWAQRVGGLVDGRLTVGTLAGLAVGSASTLAPLLVLWSGVRFRKTWKRAVIFVASAALAAAPNLILLGITLGDGNAAHAGERILDVEGPGFRGASLVGAILGALAFAAVLYLATSRGINRRRAKEMRGQLRERDERSAAPKQE